ncbi:ATP-grasp domain-containing protein [Streptomyces sp. NPDC088752]|uniref:ATP-grasp domain-containing protein n=1 Tax=Streptomyces sp. NPDC088752 TaxID=3154963 RepID=UPI00343C0CBC
MSELLRKRGKRPVLVSEDARDINRDACDVHVIVDWEATELDEAATRIARSGVLPTGVVNLVDPLVGWQARLARSYGLPGGEQAREKLASKASVREEMGLAGLSTLWFASGRADSFPVDSVPGYPLIVKPCTDSGASRLVRRADCETQLRDHLRDITDAAGPDFQVIVEEYVDGTEMSIDGPVLDGVFTGLFVVEKNGRDEERNHDTGVLVSPPSSGRVTSAAEVMTDRISALCRRLGLSEGWLHVEARVSADGSCELIEINPRVAGGMHPAAITRTCGVDAVEVMVRMAIAEEDGRELKSCVRSDEVVGLINLEPRSEGDVVAETSLEQMLGVAGVVDGYVWQPFRVSSLEQENFFAAFMVAGPDEAEVMAAVERVHGAFSFHVVP